MSAINELNYDLAEQNTFVNQGIEYCVVCMFNRTSFHHGVEES